MLRLSQRGIYMKNPFLAVYAVLGFMLVSFSILAGCTGSFTMPTGAVATPVPTNTPCPYCTPTFTMTPAPPTPTFSPTPNATVTIPMGVVVTGAFDGSVMNIYGYSITITAGTVAISYNHAAYPSATVYLNTPLDGSILLTYLTDQNLGTYTISQYSSATQFTYVPNGLYSLSVSGGFGTASSSMNAPGGITFSANGASVTAAYPGNIDQAQVSESSPTARSTFVSNPAVSVGSPYIYPGSAFPDSPGTYSETYSVGLTVMSFTGTAGAQGTFVGNETLSSNFTR